MSWNINGVPYTGRVVTLGTGKDFTTFDDIRVAYPSEDVLVLAYNGIYGSGDTFFSDYNTYLKAMESDVVLSNILGDVLNSTSTAKIVVEGCKLQGIFYFEDVYHRYLSNIVLSKCYILPHYRGVGVYGTTGSVLVRYCTVDGGKPIAECQLTGDGTGVSIHRCVGASLGGGVWVEADFSVTEIDDYGWNYGDDYIQQTETIVYTDSNGLNPTETPDENTVYEVHSFYGSGSITLPTLKQVDYLIVAGGGAGGTPTGVFEGGGGGAGGVLEGTVFLSTGNIVVGGGGIPLSVDGENSSLNTIVAYGGGGGGTNGAGRNGGSGGGGTYSSGAGGTGIVGQGFDGEANHFYLGETDRGCGGGGAGEVGGTDLHAYGGDGIESSISGIPTYYGGGGGGLGWSGSAYYSGQGGQGGGGNGASTLGETGQSGTPNTGGGGGGGSNYGGVKCLGGNGGSGIVIIRFLYMPTSTDRYWVGGTGIWEAITNWSDSSGGSGGYSIPTSADSVYFDANSFTDGGQTVTVSAGVCNSMTWNAVPYLPSLLFGESGYITTYGDITLYHAMYLEYTAPDLNAFAHSSFMLEYTPVVSRFKIGGDCHLATDTLPVPPIEVLENGTLYLTEDTTFTTLWVRGDFDAQGYNITAQGIKFEPADT